MGQKKKRSEIIVWRMIGENDKDTFRLLHSSVKYSYEKREGIMGGIGIKAGIQIRS